MNRLVHTFEKIKCSIYAMVGFVSIHRWGYKDVIICNHIGDFLFTLGYLREYKKENEITHLRVTCSERLYELAEYYDDIGQINVVNIWVINSIRELYHYKTGRSIIKRLLKAIVIEPAYEYENLFDSMISKKDMTLKRSICEDVLHIRNTENYDNPFSKYTFETSCQSRILICPSATLIDDSSADILYEAASILKAQGYNLDYNDSFGESFSSLPDVVRHSHSYIAVIGIRSGLLDLLALCGCNVIAIYPCEYKLVHYFGITNNHRTGQMLYDYVVSGDTGFDINNILQLVREIKSGY